MRTTRSSRLRIIDETWMPRRSISPIAAVQRDDGDKKHESNAISSAAANTIEDEHDRTIAGEHAGKGGAGFGEDLEHARCVGVADVGVDEDLADRGC